MEFIIRQAEPRDAEAATQLALRAKASWGYPPDWLEAWRDELVIRPEYLATHHALVAVVEGDVVGLCVLEARRAGAALEHMWIAPEYQRRGVGRTLVEHALRFAARSGVSRVEVLSDPFAESFYRNLGARVTGSRPAPMPGAPERALPQLEFVLGPDPGGGG